ncbi:MAG: GcrA cell cycle regulator [Hyphomicrobiales bacterium]|nr:GcrA cell cycle regulator [Hyphomicrobiales bacterium]
MAWTDERVEILTKLWAEGLSASQIANRLGGVTRNAVIGKVHRLGLSGRTTTSRAKAPRQRRRTSSKTARGGGATLRTHGNVALKAYYDPEANVEPEMVPAPIQELFIPVSERASILTLKETMCRWPIGDPGEDEFHFCGRSSDQGVPYCEFHSRIAYQPAQSRRRAR